MHPHTETSNNKKQSIDILAIVAHPDDAELCCAGTLLKHHQLGYSIGIIDLTRGELGSRGSAEIREQEAQEATQILQLSVRENLNLGDGTFENNHKTRCKVIECIRKYTPQIIITNAVNDRHPDHARAASLVAEASFYSGLLKIQTIMHGKEQQVWRPSQLWHMIQDRHITPDITIDITTEYPIKQKAIQAFSSQFYATAQNEGPQTPISSIEFWEFIEARARELGRPIGATYAEGFTRSRSIGVRDLFDLV